MHRIFGIFVLLIFVPEISSAASLSEQIDTSGKNGKYTYVMFFSDDDSATQNMANMIRSHVEETSKKTTWVRVNVNDSNEAKLVKQFDALRMPLPAVFGVAPNGAVTGVYGKKVNQKQLANAILTPKYSDMVKALQSQRIAVVCMMPEKESSIPVGVMTLKLNPAFQGKLKIVKAYATDKAEAEFFRRMKVDSNLNEPSVLIFTPPGTHVGTFTAATNGAKLAQELHDTGKCNCSQCQKHRAGQ